MRVECNLGVDAYTKIIVNLADGQLVFHLEISFDIERITAIRAQTICYNLPPVYKTNQNSL